MMKGQSDVTALLEGLELTDMERATIAHTVCEFYKQKVLNESSIAAITKSLNS